jgi:hypothetical protein
LSEIKLFIALIHYPVINKAGEVITSAITGIDLHDIARLSKTYGIKRFFVVTPLKDQAELVKRLTEHWVTGAGASYNPDRKKALELIRVAKDYSNVVSEVRKFAGMTPETVVTCANKRNDAIGYPEFKQKLKNGRPYILNFGTAWGLSGEWIDNADYVLEPVYGITGYNHLSVRSAASIIIDRLLHDN